MPEESVVDAPDIGLGNPSETPDTSEQVAEGGLFAPEPDASAPSSDAADSPNASTADTDFDWDKVDLRRARPEDVPEQYRPQFKVMQKQVKAMQAESTRQMQDLQRREQDLQSRSSEMETLKQQIAQLQQAQQQPMTAEQKQKVAQLLNDPNTDAETRQALMLVDTLLQERFQELVGDKLAKLEELQGVVPQFQQFVDTMTKQQYKAHFDGLATQVQEAKADHGDDVNAYADDIKRIMGLGEDWMPSGRPMINRATGEPYTIKSAYEFLSGKTAQQSQQARAEDLRIRTEAKKSVSQGPASTAPPNNGGLSESELDAELGKLGWK